jgi:hypothetical protein
VNAPTDFFTGRQSSFEADTSEDIEEDWSTEGGELVEHLGWPPELLIAPKTHKRSTRHNGIHPDTSEARDDERRETMRPGNSLIDGGTCWAGWPGEGSSHDQAPGGLAGLGSPDAGGAAWPSRERAYSVPGGGIL